MQYHIEWVTVSARANSQLLWVIISAIDIFGPPFNNWGVPKRVEICGLS